MKQILYVFTTWTKDDDTIVAKPFEPNIYVQSPHVLLDSVFLHNKKVCFDSLLLYYGYMTNFILNRLDEVMFSIEQYPKDFLDMSKYMIHFLKQRTK